VVVTTQSAGQRVVNLRSSSCIAQLQRAAIQPAFTKAFAPASGSNQQVVRKRLCQRIEPQAPGPRPTRQGCGGDGVIGRNRKKVPWGKQPSSVDPNRFGNHALRASSGQY